MKFSISYKFKLKMAQNLSGRSGPVQGRSGPVGAGQGRSVPVVPVRCRSVPVRAGQGRSVPVPVPVPLVPPVPVPTGADRCRCRWQTARNAVYIDFLFLLNKSFLKFILVFRCSQGQIKIEKLRSASINYLD